jgi:hypothetical protein
MTYYGTNKGYFTQLKFKLQVLKENHDSPTVGHVGFFKTYYNILLVFLLEGYAV